MINDLEEAIAHCEEVAKEQDKLCKRYDDASGYSRSHNEAIRVDNAKRCEECAKEHRQLAEWLKELIAYRKAEKEMEQELVNWNDIDNGKCRGLFLATSIIQHYKDEEVNADGAEENS